ncbi:SIMPL domain-containing protein [Haloarchaeobius sp. DT45]|uniref:SIMPL domain-containing protein n=1 Tax=Haloarchaeobius sp. DT45 TaxID=3446116 RepID=UPI003F6C9B6D
MSPRTITTTAVGRASAQPDEVALRFAATAVEPDVSGARRAVAERAAELRRVLGEVGIPDDQIRTVRFSVARQPPGHPSNPTNRPGETPDPESLPYHATEAIAVTLWDLDLLAETLSAAVDEAGAEISDVDFTFRTETNRELTREAIADAVETARQKATAAATAEGLTVGDVLEMHTDDGTRPRQRGSGMHRTLSDTSGGSVESGPISTEVRVEVQYEVRNRS